MTFSLNRESEMGGREAIRRLRLYTLSYVNSEQDGFWGEKQKRLTASRLACASVLFWGRRIW